MKKPHMIMVGTAALAALILGAVYCTTVKESAEDGSYYSDGCTIAGINAHGEFVTYATEYDSVTETALNEAPSEEIVFAIKAAEDNENIKGILLDIDSYGGSPVAGEEIANALRNAKKPTVALIRGAGTSAAYWAASGASHIIASELSDVGSIGATVSYTDSSKYNQREGLTFNQLSTGIYKDFGNPDKPLTVDERALVMRDLYLIKDKFVRDVAINRSISVADVEKLADGASVLGVAAKELRLIDEIGSYTEAEKYLTNKTGVQAEVCW